MNSMVQIHTAGNRVLPNASRASFWRLTQAGRVVGWAIGYQAAVAKARHIEQVQAGQQPLQVAA
ncbi:hypothetical protein SAMN05216198_1533 [Halopseudomonas litoralis]|uniref:Uncharacterized protein n=1 Tax=Halopseudomonas litoralis TaxID=797277 RepID=A0A1H1QN37_9GAMM|nr:hypothetical protein [Halopseudomonas litoralis]SDS24890.1 hypothetical protein SAMN05216198_1533 [Halopseudomonas litoralis]